MRLIPLVVLALLFGLTSKQVQVWTSERALWENAVAVSPRAPGPRLALGRSFQHLHLFNEAAAQYAEAYQDSVDTADEPIYLFALQVNTAKMLYDQGQQEEAVALLARVSSNDLGQKQAADLIRASMLHKMGASCVVLKLMRLPCADL
jgi:hypothetical protein